MKKFVKYPSSYVQASTSSGKAVIADVVRNIVNYLTELGLEDIDTHTLGYGKKAGYYSGGVRFELRYANYDDVARQEHIDWLRDRNPDEYPDEETATNFVDRFTNSKRAGYHNFITLQELYGAVGEEESHDPIRRAGGGYPQLSKDLQKDIEDHLHDSGYDNVTVKLDRDGFWGICETIQFYFYVPKSI